METQLLDWSIRAVMMAAGTAVASSALRVRTPAARHMAWAGVLVAMLLLPAVTTWGPKVAGPVLPAVGQQLAPEPTAPEVRSMRPASQYVEDKRTTNTLVTSPDREVEPLGVTWNWQWIINVSISSSPFSSRVLGA